MGAGEAFEQPAAFRRLVLIECREFQIFDIEGDAIAEGQHHDDGTERRRRPAGRDRAAAPRFAPGIGPQPSGIEPLGRTRLGRARPRAVPLGCGALGLLRFVGSARLLQIADEGVFERGAAALA